MRILALAGSFVAYCAASCKGVSGVITSDFCLPADSPAAHLPHSRRAPTFSALRTLSQGLKRNARIHQRAQQHVAA